MSPLSIYLTACTLSWKHMSGHLHRASQATYKGQSGHFTGPVRPLTMGQSGHFTWPVRCLCRDHYMYSTCIIWQLSHLPLQPNGRGFHSTQQQPEKWQIVHLCFRSRDVILIEGYKNNSEFSRVQFFFVDPLCRTSASLIWSRSDISNGNDLIKQDFFVVVICYLYKSLISLFLVYSVCILGNSRNARFYWYL